MIKKILEWKKEFEGKMSAANGIIVLMKFCLCSKKEHLFIQNLPNARWFSSTGGHVNVAFRLFCCKSAFSYIAWEMKGALPSWAAVAVLTLRLYFEMGVMSSEQSCRSCVTLLASSCVTGSRWHCTIADLCLTSQFFFLKGFSMPSAALF